jgi:hypothetical protein
MTINMLMGKLINGIFAAGFTKENQAIATG